MWQESKLIDGKEFRITRLNKNSPVGVSDLVVIDGVPDRYLDILLASAQVCDVPHTWCVKTFDAVESVDQSTLKIAKEVFQQDLKNYNASVFTYLGDNQFLGAGAIRNKINKNYQNDEFPVVSRAIVHPAWRSKGVGSILVEHRMKAVLNYYPKAPKAIHFGTQSPQILSTVSRLGLPFVHIGNERYQTKKGIHVIKDYLWFLPHYQEMLLKEAQSEEFKRKLKLFMQSGIKEVTLKELEALNESGPLIKEFFHVTKMIGVEDD